MSMTSQTHRALCDSLDGGLLRREGDPLHRSLVPLDREARDAGLICKHAANDARHVRGLRRIVAQFLRVVLVVHVIADAHKLAASVEARDEQHGDAEQVLSRNLARVRRIRLMGKVVSVGLRSKARSTYLEGELIVTDRDGADENGFELLVVPVSLSGADVDDVPLEV